MYSVTLCAWSNINQREEVKESKGEAQQRDEGEEDLVVTTSARGAGESSTRALALVPVLVLVLVHGSVYE